MPDAPSAALAADLRPWPLAFEWRALNAFGVLSIISGINIITCVLQSSPLGRSGLGLLVAAVIICCGEILSRLKGSDWQPYFWAMGTTMIGCGYLMAYFIARSTFYVSGFESFSGPQPCWLMELLLVAAVTLHVNSNRFLRWLALPFSVYVSGEVFLSALASSNTLSVVGFTVSIPALACVSGMAWWSLLSVAYRYLEQKYCATTAGAPSGRDADWLLFRCGGELSFGLSVVSAIIMPLYLDTLDYAPLWWSIEMPVLLMLCRRSQTFFKPCFIMAIWLASALMTLYPGVALLMLAAVKGGGNPVHFNLLVSLSVPVSGLVMAFAHRLENQSWPLWQRLTGYSIYLYGSAAATTAILLLHLGTVGALPYWLIEVGVMLAMGLYLRDRALEAIACIASVAVLSVYGLHWHHWNAELTTIVVVGCYSMCVAFGIIKKRGGLLQGSFAVWPNGYTLSSREARLLELAAALLGYVSVMTGTYLLLGDSLDPTGVFGGTWLAAAISWLQIYIHYNTIAWCVCAMTLAAYGLYTNKLEHRFCGVLALILAVAKLCVLDLSTSGASGLARASISTIAVAICCIAMGSLYMGTTSWLEQNTNHTSPSSKKDKDEDGPSEP